MRNINSDKRLSELFDRVLFYADKFNRTLPEMRFFILSGMEFASLLEKNVYPTSPMNIWEGKRMVNKKHRIETGQESSLYYEVVQTGNPSYAYLNDGNSDMMQASVMAHVVGHCEFSELTVLKDSDRDRTEYVMHLVKKVDRARMRMGDKSYLSFWNACESILPFLAPNSQFNVRRSVDTDTETNEDFDNEEPASANTSRYSFVSSSLDSILYAEQDQNVFEKDLKKKLRKANLDRKGYTLRAPCQDVMGFLRKFGPISPSERSILDYMYTTHVHQDFIIRTQIMNEGWAMYWEKKIMMELFKEKAVKGIIEYSKVFSGVCFPRPYFQRNPYHLGFQLWNHIENLYKEGKVNLEYMQETDLQKKETWKQSPHEEPIKSMEHLIGTVTDYEFLRRFLTTDLIHEFHLNRIHKSMAERLGVKPNDVVQESKHWVWLHPEPIKDEMLNFFTHFYRPRIYIIDTDFYDGGLLLYHRHDGRDLRHNWIKPTLKNLNLLWKGPVALLSKDNLYRYVGKEYQEVKVKEVSFERIQYRMQKQQKPFKIV